MPEKSDKRKVGRPSKYSKDCATQAKKLCELGATDADLADFFGVFTSTIWRWSSRYPEFCNALKIGKEKADHAVERSLFQRARGYEYDSEKIMLYEGTPIRIPYREKQPPDTTACIFWLKNRKPAEWRDRVEHTGKDGAPIFGKPAENELIERMANRLKLSGVPMEQIIASVEALLGEKLITDGGDTLGSVH